MIAIIIIKHTVSPVRFGRIDPVECPHGNFITWKNSGIVLNRVPS